MDQGRVSVSYAKALFDWASKTARIDEVYQQTGTKTNLKNIIELAFEKSNAAAV